MPTLFLSWQEVKQETKPACSGCSDDNGGFGIRFDFREKRGTIQIKDSIAQS